MHHTIQRISQIVAPQMPPTTSSLFNNPDADVILRSVDGVDFYIDLAVLAMASPVFKDMSTLPLPASKIAKDRRSVITMHESSTTLELLLQLVHPAMYPHLQDVTLDIFRDVLVAADKYEMAKVVPALEATLDNTRFFKEHASAFRVFALASRFGMRTLARAAARTLLTFPPPSDLPAALPELETVPAAAYHRLLKYRAACFAVLFPPIDGVADYRSWVQVWWSTVRRSSGWNIGCFWNPTWTSCSSCSSSEPPGSILTSWFIDHVERMKVAYYKNVTAQTLLSMELLAPTIQSLMWSGPQCSCKTIAPLELSSLTRALATEVEKQLATVSHIVIEIVAP